MHNVINAVLFCVVLQSLGLVGGVVSASLVTYVALSLRPPPQYAAVPGGATPGEAGGAGPSADHPDHEL